MENNEAEKEFKKVLALAEDIKEMESIDVQSSSLTDEEKPTQKMDEQMDEICCYADIAFYADFDSVRISVFSKTRYNCTIC